MLRPDAITIIGISVSPNPPEMEPFKCRAVLICATCDLPAKVMVLNFIRFNGFYGCCCCMQPGL